MNSLLEKNIINFPKKEDKIKIHKTININRKIPTSLTTKFIQQYQYLCKKISTVEWSGVLFYTLHGTVSNITGITLEEIFLMDKGTGGYTSYEFDNEVIEFMMDNPYLLNMRIGHIHSHNTMNTFFSGTDVSELEDNSPNHLLYLSVIVNNYNSIVGKIAIFSQAKPVTSFQIRDENGKPFTMYLKGLETQENIMLTYDCEFPVENTEIDAVFEARLSVIEKKVTKYPTNYNAGYSNYGKYLDDKTNSVNSNSHVNRDIPIGLPKSHTPLNFKVADDDFTFQHNFSNEDDFSNEIPEYPDSFYVEQFLSFILMESVHKGEDSLEEVDNMEYVDEFIYIFRNHLQSGSLYRPSFVKEVVETSYIPFWKEIMDTEFVQNQFFITHKLVIYEQVTDILFEVKESVEIHSALSKKERNKILNFIVSLNKIFENLIEQIRLQKNG